MKKPFAAILALAAALLPAPGASAQTAAELERVLALPAVSYGEAAWVVLNAAGTVLPEAGEESSENSGDSSGVGAYRFSADNKWLSKKAAAEVPLTLAELSFLIMKAFTLKGGFMYSLFPGPRYGYRELTYRKIIRGRAYSTMTVSGAQLLRIISRALDYAGDPAALPPVSAAMTEAQPEIPAEETPVELPPAEETVALEPARIPEPVEEPPPPAVPPVQEEPEIPAEETLAELPSAEDAVVPEPPRIPEPAEETPPPAAPPVQEERERVAEIINMELEEKGVEDTDARATGEGITISLNNIQFLPDSTELTEAEKRNLQNIAVILNEFPDRKILVAGHAAMAGSAEGRMRVSEDRARAVADYLVSLGCRKPDEITIRGYGAERPLGDPAAMEGQALNRRVEITLLDEGSGE
jgi:outer membrane protein OmpA-like peptidoglycan-associated protein